MGVGGGVGVCSLRRPQHYKNNTRAARAPKNKHNNQHKKTTKLNLRDFFVWLAAFLGTLFLGIELGLGISIVLALLVVIFESAFPHTAVLGRIAHSSVYR